MGIAMLLLMIVTRRSLLRLVDITVDVNVGKHVRIFLKKKTFFLLLTERLSHTVLKILSYGL